MIQKISFEEDLELKKLAYQFQYCMKDPSHAANQIVEPFTTLDVNEEMCPGRYIDTVELSKKRLDELAM